VSRVLKEDEMNDNGRGPTGFVRKPPRMKGSPILGVLPQAKQAPLDFFLRAALDYGDVVQMDMGPSRLILVSHPEQIRYILQDNPQNFPKGYDRVRTLLGHGLLASEGELWKNQRRLMQPAFNRPALADLVPTIEHAVMEMVTFWRRRTADQPLDIAAELNLLTQNIIVRTMFGTDLGPQALDASAAFATALSFLNSMLFTPIPHIEKLPLPSTLRFRGAVNTLDEIIYQIIARRRLSSQEHHDLLQTLMDTRDENGQPLSEQQLRDEVMTIFLAGHETTAALLAWVIFQLSQHPEIEGLARGEMERLPVGRDATLEEITALTFTRMVIDETLRLYPPAWIFARRSIEEDEVSGYTIPGRSTILISPYVTQRRPDLWDRPDEFIPERFSRENAGKRVQFAYFPFGGGPRRCIGSHLALMEAPLILARLVPNFNFELIPEQTVTARPVGSLRPQPGLWMRVKAR